MGATAHAEPLRTGVVGGGFLGRTVGGEFASHPDAAVVALTDVDEAARAETAVELSIPESSQYADYESMLAAEALDAVLIATPHTLHYDQVAAALDRGLHVYCDKPLVTDLDRARELAAFDERTDQTLMVGYQRHLNPAFVRARERFRGGDGPTHVTAEITQNWYDRFRDTWRTDPALSGGGNLYDTGSHLLDAVLWVSGHTPTAVNATMAFADADRRVDTSADLLVEFAEGASASVSVFSDAPCVREDIRFWDDDGGLVVEGRAWEPRELTRIDADSGEYTPYIDRKGQRSRPDAFVESVREGVDPPATARDALKVTAVTEAAYESARSGEWVDVRLD